MGLRSLDGSLGPLLCGSRPLGRGRLRRLWGSGTLRRSLRGLRCAWLAWLIRGGLGDGLHRSRRGGNGRWLCLRRFGLCRGLVSG